MKPAGLAVFTAVLAVAAVLPDPGMRLSSRACSVTALSSPAQPKAARKSQISASAHRRCV